ncbi:hypothetical protein MtrunA17_Chr8g0364951 [Medicago truncatula]|uniref:Uncharacterized protein n=1 Tax=Medicago truncatula TaxID=3880 RepID=A0A396GMA6_MEDTR|nr:hypothetical protein MtrunA17_Chr8g0364951 [Medicago truncatula]
MKVAIVNFFARSLVCFSRPEFEMLPLAPTMSLQNLDDKEVSIFYVVSKGLRK